MKYKYGNEQIRIPVPEKRNNEMFAIVNKVLGGSRMNVSCEDGKKRLARIPGGKKRRIRRIRIGDLLIISPWDIQDSKADILHKYRRNQAHFLDRKGIIPTEITPL